jgi:hypothetical protein
MGTVWNCDTGVPAVRGLHLAPFKKAIAGFVAPIDRFGRSNDGRADAFRRGIRSDFWMHWGAEESAGHYVDLGSALPGLTLFPIGYLAHALARSRVRRLATSSPCTSEHLVLIRRAFNLKQLRLGWRMGSGMAGGWPARRIAVRFWPSAHLSGVIDKNEELDTAASPKATQEKALL